MPDPILIGVALVTAALTSSLLAAATLYCQRRCQRVGPIMESLPAMLWPWAIVGGLVAGLWQLGRLPHWPPVTDLDRLLIGVVPIVVILESVAGTGSVRMRVVWLIRSALGFGLGRAVLHGSIHLASASESASNVATFFQTLGLLVALGLLVVAVWFSLSQMERCVGSAVLQLAIALTAAVAGLSIMLSGYLSAGQVAIGLAGATGGAAIVAMLGPGKFLHATDIGTPLVILCGLLLGGHFFAKLLAGHALLLLTAPVWTSLALAPRIRHLPKQLRSGLGLLLVCIPLAIVLTQSIQHYVQRSGSPPSTPAVDIDAYRSLGERATGPKEPDKDTIEQEPPPMDLLPTGPPLP